MGSCPREQPELPTALGCLLPAAAAVNVGRAAVPGPVSGAGRPRTPDGAFSLATDDVTISLVDLPQLILSANCLAYFYVEIKCSTPQRHKSHSQGSTCLEFLKMTPAQATTAAATSLGVSASFVIWGQIRGRPGPGPTLLRFGGPWGSHRRVAEVAAAGPPPWARPAAAREAADAARLPRPGPRRMSAARPGWPSPQGPSRPSCTTAPPSRRCPGAPWPWRSWTSRL